VATLAAMNDAQTIFAVFYAIFWGGVFSVLSRWKPFNHGLIFNKDKKEIEHISKRIRLSLLILNILPLIYFVGIFYILGLKGNLCKLQKDCGIDVSAMVLSDVIPAFAILGFYRLFIGIVEYNPTKYYKYSYEIPIEYRKFWFG
jgi:hypothetical protein